MILNMPKEKHKKGFSLIETVLSISIFLVTILILLAMFGPLLTSFDEVEESDEVSSIVESLNSYLQAKSSLATNGSNFDLIYEAVKSRGYATVYIFHSYVSENSPNIQLSIGFTPKETTSSIRMDRRAKIYNFENSAGPIYRAIITSAPHMPKQYYRDRGRSAKPRYYLTADSDTFKNNYLPLEISLYSNDQRIGFIDTMKLQDILKEEPIIKYFTVINR
jgi:type II secretory pathway pseudopilin PulG